MKPPLISNENAWIGPGDVDVFATIAEAELYFEPWIVDQPVYIFDAEGRRLRFIADGNRVRIVPSPDTERHADLVKSYLTHFLRSIADAKGWDYVGVSPEWCDSADLSDLVTKSLDFTTK